MVTPRLLNTNDLVDFRGAPGPPGADGLDGEPGPAGEAGPPGADGADGGGGAVEEIWYGYATHAAATNPSGFAVVAGDYTVGMSFTVWRDVTITGVRFYWPDATSRTIKGALRDEGGTTVASGNLAIAASGLHELTFSTPANISPPSGATAVYTLAIYEDTGSVYVRTLTAPPLVGPGWTGTAQVPYSISRSIIAQHYMRYSGGDANPAYTGGTESFPVEPILEDVGGGGGAAGADGAPGPPGMDGEDGAPGADGLDGAPGATGAAGAAGVAGLMGPPGLDGADGAEGPPGPPGPPGPAGANGAGGGPDWFY